MILDVGAAYVGGTAATDRDAHCSGGGAEPPPPQTPTWAAVVGSRSLRRRPLPRRRGRTAADDDEDYEAKVLYPESISKSPGMYWMFWDVLGCIMHVLDLFWMY